MSRGVWPRMVSESISELSTDLMGRAEPVVEMAGQAGSGICTTGSGCGEDDKTAPPNGLSVGEAREETKNRGRHSDEWWHLKGLEEAEDEEGSLR